MLDETAEILDYYTEEEEEKEIPAMHRKKNAASKEVEKEGETGRVFLTDLPESIVFDILVKVPSKYLYKNGMQVCRAWRDIISTSQFVSQNYIESKSGLLIGGPSSRKNQYFDVKVLMETETMQRDYEYKVLHFGVGRMGQIRSSCNGLILVNHPKQKWLLQVMNPVTKVGLTLPKCPSGCPHKACGSALGFDPNKNKYKVVHIYADSFGFEILTLGCPDDQKWRRIPGPWKDNLHERPFDFEKFSWGYPVSSVNGRILHWYVNSAEYIVSMDVSEEITWKTYLPNIQEEMIKRDRYTLVEMSGYLSLVHNIYDNQIDVWVLEDSIEQRWSKKHSIHLELTKYLTSPPQNCLTSAMPDLSKLAVVASMRNGEILILKHENYCLYAYEVRSCVMKKLKVNMKHPFRFIPHTSSLLHWS